MVNDTTTLNGALTELGETMATNISAKGVTASASDGLTTLAGKISQIQTGGSGCPRLVTGSFTTGSTRNTVETVTLSYNGNGYPIACMVYVDNGFVGNTTWYNLVSQYDIGTFYMTKAVMNTTPTYAQSGTENYGAFVAIYKSSSTSATSYSSARAENSSVYNVNNPAYPVPVNFKGNGVTLAYLIGNNTSTTRGLVPSMKYCYIVIYSE